MCRQHANKLSNPPGPVRSHRPKSTRRSRRSATSRVSNGLRPPSSRDRDCSGTTDPAHGLISPRGRRPHFARAGTSRRTLNLFSGERVDGLFVPTRMCEVRVRENAALYGIAQRGVPTEGAPCIALPWTLPIASGCWPPTNESACCRVPTGGPPSGFGSIRFCGPWRFRQLEESLHPCCFLPF